MDIAAFLAWFYQNYVDIPHKDALPIQINNDIDINNNPKDCSDVGMPQVLCYVEFWLLYGIFFIVTGCGLMWINNVSQIVESASETSDDDDNANDTVATALVSVTSIGNFTGRLFAGILSDRFRNRVCRVFWAQISCLGMCLTYTYLYFIGTTLYLFYFGAFAVGVSFGLIFTTTIASCCDLWGSKYLSGNYSTIDSAPCFASLTFATFIFGHFYDKKGEDEGDGNKCWGHKCYQQSFLICIAASAVGLILSHILYRVVQNKSTQKKQTKFVIFCR